MYTKSEEISKAVFAWVWREDFWSVPKDEIMWNPAILQAREEFQESKPMSFWTSWWEVRGTRALDSG